MRRGWWGPCECFQTALRPADDSALPRPPKPGPIEEVRRVTSQRLTELVDELKRLVPSLAALKVADGCPTNLQHLGELRLSHAAGFPEFANAEGYGAHTAQGTGQPYTRQMYGLGVH